MGLVLEIIGQQEGPLILISAFQDLGESRLYFCNETTQKEKQCWLN